MLFRKYLKLEYWRLLLYGIHVGHSFKNSILFAAWFIFTYRQNLYIINLYKTLWNMRNGFVGIDHCVRFGNPVWFINIERSTEVYIRSSAKTCGEFSYTTYWIHGMISNYRYILLSLAKLNRYFEDAWKGTWKKLEFQWFFSRYTWPRSVFISNIFNNRWPSNECTVSATPCLGIVDTNVSGDDTNIATPGNDDSNDSIVFYNSYFSKYIIDKKYGIIVRWLNVIRKKKRILSFAEWFRLTFIDAKLKFKQEKYNESKKIYAMSLRETTKSKRSFIVKYKFPFWKYFVNGILYFFGMDRFYNKSFFEALDVYEPRYYYKIKPEIYKWMYSLHKDTIFLMRIGRYYLTKHCWTYYGYVKKKNLSNSVFRLRHLRGVYLKRIKKRDNFYFTNFILNRFNVNRFYKTFLRRRRYRRNKFVNRYLKFYYLNKYINKLGLLRYYKAIFVKISSFAHVSFTLCSYNYKNKFFSPFLNNLAYGYRAKIKEYNTLYKWIQFKPIIIEYLNFIINNNKINKYVKFLYIYKVYIKFKKTLYRKFWAPALFWQFNYYLINWYSSRRLFNLYKKRKKFKFVVWKRLKKIRQYYTYFNIFYKSLYFKKKFEYCFLDKVKSKYLHYNSCKYFRLISKYYRNKMLRYTISWRYKRILKIFRHFRKIKKYWLRYRVKTLLLISRLLKKDMIKEEYKSKLLGLRDRFRANHYIFNLIQKWYKLKNKRLFRKSYNLFRTDTAKRFYYSKSEKFNVMKLKKFAYLFRNFYGVKRLYNIYNKKYNREFSMNFFEISKIFYNHEIIDDWIDVKHFDNLELKNETFREKAKEILFFQFLNKFHKDKRMKQYYFNAFNWTLMYKRSLKRNLLEKYFIKCSNYKILEKKKRKRKFKNIYNLFYRKNKSNVNIRLLRRRNLRKWMRLRLKYYLLSSLFRLRKKFINFKKSYITKLNWYPKIWFFNSKSIIYRKIKILHYNYKLFSFFFFNKINKYKIMTAITYLYMIKIYFYYFKYFLFKQGLHSLLKEKRYLNYIKNSKKKNMIFY